MNYSEITRKVVCSHKPFSKYSCFIWLLLATWLTLVFYQCKTLKKLASASCIIPKEVYMYRLFSWTNLEIMTFTIEICVNKIYIMSYQFIWICLVLKGSINVYPIYKPLLTVFDLIESLSQRHLCINVANLTCLPLPSGDLYHSS